MAETPKDPTQEFEEALEELEEEIEEQAEHPPIPDKPTNIAPGAVEYPGKGAAPKGSKGGASPNEAERGGKTGPKGADYKAANQS